MKAYVVSEAAPVFPFRRAASTFLLGDETVGARLRRQLTQAGFEVIEGPANEGPGVVVHDNVVLADATVKRLASHARRQGQGTVQYSVDTTAMHTVRADGLTERVQALPVWVFGSRFGQGTLEQLPIAPLFELPVGFPSAVFGLRNVRVAALHEFAVAIERWPDVLNASTLVARELGAKLYVFFAHFLPVPVLRWALSSPRLTGLFNRTGRRCRVHHTAVLEGCVLGDDVEVGAHVYMRGAIIGSGAVIREGSSVQAAVIGPGSYLMRCEVANAAIGAGTVVATQMIFNAVIGNDTFIGGGAGFADYLNANRDVELRLPTGTVSSNQRFLASGVGDTCFIGAGLLFSPGEAIPSGSHVLNPNLIHHVPAEFDQILAASRGGLTRIPASFVKGAP